MDARETRALRTDYARETRALRLLNDEFLHEVDAFTMDADEVGAGGEGADVDTRGEIVTLCGTQSTTMDGAAVHVDDGNLNFTINAADGDGGYIARGVREDGELAVGCWLVAGDTVTVGGGEVNLV